MKVAQSCVTFILQARILESVAFPFSREASQSGLEPRSPALQADSLPAEPQGKPKNIGVGSLSLLQGIFPTQESNQGLLHCRWILYQLSYQGSEKISCVGRKFFTTSACKNQRYSLLPHGTCQVPLSMGFSGQNTGVVSLSLLQGIFPTQG